MRRLLRLTNSQGPPPIRKSIAVRFGLEKRDQSSQPEDGSATVENQSPPHPVAAEVAKAS